jgi:hypothetical protein
MPLVSENTRTEIGISKVPTRSHDAVIRVYDETGNVIETHQHAGEFKEW